jgi:hypothetical protein
MAGRPTKYNFELAKEICEQLYDKSLSDVLRSKKNYPARSTFFLWKRENSELSDLYVNIAQDKGVLFIEEIDQTIIDLKNGKIDPSTANVIIQALKWKAAKFYPKMFGDKSEVDITSKGEKISTNNYFELPLDELEKKLNERKAKLD